MPIVKIVPGLLWDYLVLKIGISPWPLTLQWPCNDLQVGIILWSNKDHLMWVLYPEHAIIYPDYWPYLCQNEQLYTNLGHEIDIWPWSLTLIWPSQLIK